MAIRRSRRLDMTQFSETQSMPWMRIGCKSPRVADGLRQGIALSLAGSEDQL